MKDYSGEGKKGSFILNYDVEVVNFRKLIIVHYADGSNKREEYSAEREKEILEVMRRQVVNSSERYDELRRLFSMGLLWTIELGGLSAVFLMLAIFAATGWVPLVLFGIFSPTFIYALFATIEKHKMISDIDKNTLFVNNMNLFDKNDIDEKALSKVNKKTREVIANKKLTLNDMDNVSISSLRTLVYNMRYNKDNADVKKLVRK